jgi:hypothetical protein
MHPYDGAKERALVPLMIVQNMVVTMNSSVIHIQGKSVQYDF